MIYEGKQAVKASLLVTLTLVVTAYFPFYTYEKCIVKVIPANIYLFKVNNRNNRKRCEICLKSTIIVRVLTTKCGC